MFSTFGELTFKFGSICFIITQTAPRSDAVAPHIPPLAICKFILYKVLTSRPSSGSRFLRSPTRTRPCRKGYFQKVPTTAPGVPLGSYSVDNGSSRTGFCVKAKPGSIGRIYSTKWRFMVEWMDRTGRPPILDTAASLRSDADCTGPSGIPKNTDVSVRMTSSSSSSDQSCRVDDAIAESLVYQPGTTVAMSPWV